MVTVEMEISEDDRARFEDQARDEGMSLSAWLREAAIERYARNGGRRERDGVPDNTKAAADMRAFLEQCHANAGPGREPDWEEYLEILNESKLRGLLRS